MLTTVNNEFRSKLISGCYQRVKFFEFFKFEIKTGTIILRSDKNKTQQITSFQYGSKQWAS